MVRQLVLRAACVCAALAFGNMSAWAVVATWDEAVNGEISDDRLNPTQLNLGIGINTLKGTMGSLDEGNDLEYVRINLAAGNKLTAIILQAFTNGSDVDQVAFMGIQASTTFSFTPAQAFQNINNMIGWAHFGPGLEETPIGGNTLPVVGMAGQGFTPPLTGPNYTFWIQQTGATTNYQLGFVVTPEPSTLGLASAAGCCGLGAVRRRRRLMVA